MLSDPHTLFIGIDPSGARDGLVYVALDADRQIFAIGGGKVSDVLAFLAGQSQALAAINAPSALNQGLSEKEDVQQRLFVDPQGGRWTNLRIAEMELIQRGLDGQTTPARLRDCPAWMQRGFTLYQQLQKMGYNAFPADEGQRQWLEVNARAAFASLAQGELFEARLLEGRLQRQLLLHAEGVAVQDPMDFFEEVTRHRLLRGILPYEMILEAHELNALAGAYTAWLAVHQPERVMAVGDEREGLVRLPVRQSAD